jgi:hypothetical protein
VLTVDKVAYEPRAVMARWCRAINNFSPICVWRALTVSTIWTLDRSKEQPESRGARSSRRRSPTTASSKTFSCRIRVRSRGVRARYGRRVRIDPLIAKDDHSSSLHNAFFLAAPEDCCHCALGAGFRCRTRLDGRWMLQSIRCSARHTELAARRTPNSCSISVPIRRRVHLSVTYAVAGASALRRFASCSSFRSHSNGGRPIRPARRKPRKPSCSSCRLQRITDCRDDSTHRATSAGCIPCRSSSAARRRRCSSFFSDSRSRLTPIASSHAPHSKYLDSTCDLVCHSFTETTTNRKL